MTFNGKSEIKFNNGVIISVKKPAFTDTFEAGLENYDT